MATAQPQRDKSQDGLKRTHSLRDFKGVNTQAARQNIDDQEFSWLENVAPIGHGNIKALAGPSGILATWAPSIAFYLNTANLNDVDYLYSFTTDGAAYQVNLTTFVVIQFAPPGTFSGFGTTMAQWQNTQICIIDPTKGYFTWDGTTLTRWTGTLFSVSVLTPGMNYTTQPTIMITGGGGTGATATSDINVVLATLVAPGTTYAVNDILTAVGGTFNAPAQVQVSAVSGTGAITGFNLINSGDYTIAPTNPVSFTGGFGSGATADFNFGIGPITLTAIGSGYTSQPVVTVTGDGGINGTATANLSVVPSVGTSIATFTDRVWIGNDRTVVFSAPGSFNDFSSADGGGSFIIDDETLHSTIQSMIAANNYLYILGTTSVNVISGVQVVAGITVFSNTNISASIGSAQPYSVTSFYRSLAFAAPYGFYILSGTTPQKISDPLDGVFPDITNVIPISAGTVVLFNVICLAFMFQYIDSGLASGHAPATRTIIAVLFNKKWLFTSQGDDLTLMKTSLIGGTPTLYATEGMNMYKLLSNPLEAITQTIKTKLWDMGDPVRDKQVLKVGLETITVDFNSAITGTVDTEIPANFATFNALQGAISQVTWLNNLGQVVTWINNLGQVVMWDTFFSGYYFSKSDVETTGKYVGVSLVGTAPLQTYSAIHLQYELRAVWTTMPT